MTWQDVEQARLSIEVGIGQPVEYTDHERRLIATHEAGHATIAWLTAPQRRLEILTIIKRKGALGMLAHGDREDVYTRSRTEMEALIQIAMGGQCAEELFFGDVSTGPGGDLLYATNAAAEMIGAHGMDENLVSFAAVQNSAFTDTNIVGRVLGDEQGRAAGRGAAAAAEGDGPRAAGRNRHLVEALRDALLEQRRADRPRDHRRPRGRAGRTHRPARPPSEGRPASGRRATRLRPAQLLYLLVLLLALELAVWECFLVGARPVRPGLCRWPRVLAGGPTPCSARRAPGCSGRARGRRPRPVWLASRSPLGSTAPRATCRHRRAAGRRSCWPARGRRSGGR